MVAVTFYSMLLLFVPLLFFNCFANEIIMPTFISDNEALYLSGIRANYYFAPGSNDGVDNWIVYLPGGGWCESVESCLEYITHVGIFTPPRPKTLAGIVSSNISENPDFYNWNRIEFRYCDASSFTGNSKITYNNMTIYFRGARIFDSGIKELLTKGMGLAKNALLVGDSAGGVATMLHCDRFRALFSNSTRVKCLSNAGYFFDAKEEKGVDSNAFVNIFQGLIDLHKSIEMLPKTCTSKLSPARCFFAKNVQADIKTPIFFLVSQFDYIEIQFSTGTAKTHSYQACVGAKNCTSAQHQIMTNLRNELLNILPPKNGDLSRGYLIDNLFAHTQITDSNTLNHIIIEKNHEKISKIFGDWYFEREIVQFVEKCEKNYLCP